MVLILICFNLFGQKTKTMIGMEQEKDFIQFIIIIALIVIAYFIGFSLGQSIGIDKGKILILEKIKELLPNLKDFNKLK